MICARGTDDIWTPYITYDAPRVSDADEQLANGGWVKVVVEWGGGDLGCGGVSTMSDFNDDDV